MKTKTTSEIPLIAALLAAVLGSTIWGGCSSPLEVENPEQILLVQAFLTPGEDVAVRLYRTIPSRQYYEGLEDPVSGARVVVSTAAATIVLGEDTESPGLYTASAQLLPIAEGETYNLEVTHEDRTARAQTTVPTRARITSVIGDTITYFQRFGDLFGELSHPGEFSWARSPDAAGYIVIVEALDVSSLPVTADPLTAQLDTLIARRDRLEAEVSSDSLQVLERQIEDLRGYFDDNISLVNAFGDTTRFLRQREQDDWEEHLTEDWTEGKLWRERREELYYSRVIDYWIPADSTRGDFWWLGVRFEGEYQVTLQSVDENYFDYFTTLFNGNSGADADFGPIFHVDGGTGVFGSYSQESFRVHARRGD